MKSKYQFITKRLPSQPLSYYLSIEIMKIQGIALRLVAVIVVIQITSAKRCIRNVVNRSKLLEMANDEITKVIYENGTITELYCCAKYYLDGEVYKPYCANGCLSGSCLKPGNCICNLGYNLDESSQTCQPICPTKCPNGKCIKPNVCICNEGYELNSTSKECQPICKPICENGQCSRPGKCKCNAGYTLNNTTNVCQPICLTTCPDHSKCVKPNQCHCVKGYKTNATSRTCDPFCPGDCINGVCTSPGVCECNRGYSLDLNFSTYPKCKRNPCSTPPCSNGYCLTNGECICHEGLTNFPAFLLGTKCDGHFLQCLRLIFIFLSIGCVVCIIIVIIARISTREPIYTPVSSEDIRKHYDYEYIKNM